VVPFPSGANPKKTNHGENVMMTHDPFQNYQTPGAYQGVATPFGLPYTAFQPSFNPMGITSQSQLNPGISGYGIYPNPMQNAGIAAQLGPLQQLLALNSLLAGLQNPFQQHQQTQIPWQNPQLGYHTWPQQQFGYPQISQQNPQQQFGHPQFPQQNLGMGQQYGYPLAPQSLIGAGGMGQQTFGQIYPLAQLALRQAAGYGASPLAGCF